MKISTVITDNAILKTWEVMQLLRPHLKNHKYVKMIREMISEGYGMAYIEEDERAVSVIGFRHLQLLFNGRHIYYLRLSFFQIANAMIRSSFGTGNFQPVLLGFSLFHHQHNSHAPELLYRHPS